MVTVITIVPVATNMIGYTTHRLGGIGVWDGGITSGLIAGIAMGLVLHLGGNQINRSQRATASGAASTVSHGVRSPYTRELGRVSRLAGSRASAGTCTAPPPQVGM